MPNEAGVMWGRTCDRQILGECHRTAFAKDETMRFVGVDTCTSLAMACGSNSNVEPAIYSVLGQDHFATVKTASRSPPMVHH